MRVYFQDEQPEEKEEKTAKKKKAAPPAQKAKVKVSISQKCPMYRVGADIWIRLSAVRRRSKRLKSTS